MAPLMFALKFTVKAKAILYLVLTGAEKETTKSPLVFSDPCHTAVQPRKFRSQL